MILCFNRECRHYKDGEGEFDGDCLVSKSFDLSMEIEGREFAPLIFCEETLKYYKYEED